MPTHPAITRQQTRIASGETTSLPAPVFFQHNPAHKAVVAYGPLRKSFAVHTEAIAGANSGINQIATQDPDIAQALKDVSRMGTVTSAGSLV